MSLAVMVVISGKFKLSNTSFFSGVFTQLFCFLSQARFLKFKLGYDRLFLIDGKGSKNYNLTVDNLKRIMNMPQRKQEYRPLATSKMVKKSAAVGDAAFAYFQKHGTFPTKREDIKEFLN